MGGKELLERGHSLVRLFEDFDQRHLRPGVSHRGLLFQHGKEPGSCPVLVDPLVDLGNVVHPMQILLHGHGVDQVGLEQLETDHHLLAVVPAIHHPVDPLRAPVAVDVGGGDIGFLPEPASLQPEDPLLSPAFVTFLPLQASGVEGLGGVGDHLLVLGDVGLDGVPKLALALPGDEASPGGYRVRACVVGGSDSQLAFHPVDLLPDLEVVFGGGTVDGGSLGEEVGRLVAPLVGVGLHLPDDVGLPEGGYLGGDQ